VLNLEYFGLSDADLETEFFTKQPQCDDPRPQQS